MPQSNTEKIYKILSERENWLGSQLVDIAIKIHQALGPGLPESVYEKCFCYELTKRGILFEKQKTIPLIYDKLIIDDGLRIDILADNLIVVELKAQVLSYLKLSNKRLGYISNFNVPLMKEGIKRMIV